MCLVNPWMTPRGLPYILSIFYAVFKEQCSYIHNLLYKLRVFADLSKPNNVKLTTLVLTLRQSVDLSDTESLAFVYVSLERR